MRESRDETVGREVDYLGVATLTGGLTALVLALIEGNSWGWGSASILGLLAGSVVLLAAFVLVELKVKTPMVEFRLFASRNFVGSNVVALIVTFAMLSQFFFLALYMQNILGYSPLQAGVRFLPATLMIVAIAPIAGRLTDRIGARIPIAVGLSLVSAAMFWLTTIDTSTTYGDLFPSFILMGIGMALVMSPMSTAAMNAVADAKAGIASGILSMNRMIGGTLGVAVIGAVFQGAARSRLDDLLSGSGLTAAQRSDIAHGLGGGVSSVPAGVDHAQAAQVTSAAHDAFIGAFASSMRVATAVTVTGVVVAVTLDSLQARGPAGARACGRRGNPRRRAGDRRARHHLARSLPRIRFRDSGPGSGAGPPFAVGPHLGAVTADRHVAPGPRAVLRFVVEGPLAIVRRAGLEALPGAVDHRLVDDRHDRGDHGTRARPAHGQRWLAFVEVEAHRERRIGDRLVERLDRVPLERRAVVGLEQPAKRLSQLDRLLHLALAHPDPLG